MSTAELKELIADLYRPTRELRKSQERTNKTLEKSIEETNKTLEKLKTFRTAFPHFAGCRIYGAVAAIKYDAGLERLASKHGFFVFMPSGEVMKLANPPGFKLKAY